MGDMQLKTGKIITRLLILLFFYDATKLIFSVILRSQVIGM